MNIIALLNVWSVPSIKNLFSSRESCPSVTDHDLLFGLSYLLRYSSVTEKFGVSERTVQYRSMFPRRQVSRTHEKAQRLEGFS